ncbi:MAG: DUF5320 domain-containing protein [Candidatus Aminicenantes bacterium]|nr:DUF5320 domain-containing protein [Candidatus Aminicenantes bacterium]
MPYRDRTGPNGSGPATGRGMGPCAGSNIQGYGRRGGMGFGRGAGNRGFGGRGFGGAGYGYNNPAFQMDEKEYLSSEVESLEKNLEFLKSRLKEIETDTKK